jgi:hypothetical protein
MKTTIRKRADSTTEVVWEDGRLSGDARQLAFLQASLDLDPEAPLGGPPYPSIADPDLTKHLDFVVAVREILGWSHIEGDSPVLPPDPPGLVR